MLSQKQPSLKLPQIPAQDGGDGDGGGGGGGGDGGGGGGGDGGDSGVKHCLVFSEQAQYIYANTRAKSWNHSVGL